MLYKSVLCFAYYHSSKIKTYKIKTTTRTSSLTWTHPLSDETSNDPAKRLVSRLDRHCFRQLSFYHVRDCVSSNNKEVYWFKGGARGWLCLLVMLSFHRTIIRVFLVVLTADDVPSSRALYRHLPSRMR